MIDAFIVTGNPQEVTWHLDVDIINGRLTQVPSDVLVNTQKQRAAISALITLGSIPGQESIGADWAGYLTKKVTLIEVDNQVKQTIQLYADTQTIEDTPIPIYAPEPEGGISVSMIQIGENTKA